MGVLVVLLGVLSFLGRTLGGSPALHWNSTSCHLARPIPGRSLRSLSFLGKDAQGLALFHAQWDGHGRLQVCSRQDEPELTAAYGALCAGVFQGPDLCCREHDRCPHNVSPFQYNYGIRNYRFHTISHCNCDARFQQCLQDQRDSVSDIMGVAFFNVLAIPCFVLEEQEACVEWYWWGRCRRYGSVPLARLQPRTFYNASWSSPATSLIPSPQNPALSRPQPMQQPQQWPSEWKESKSPSKANATALQAPVASPGSDRASTVQLEVTHPGFQGTTGGRKPPGAHRACRSFRHLDQCEHQIGPQETKFQLFNSAHEPLFHCNCTSRLARFLRLHGPPVGASMLWELLGMTCFKLAPPLDCAEGKGCPRDPRAFKVSARHLLRLQQRRLQLQGTGTDNGQVWPSEDQGAPISFYNRCLQLT